MKKSIIRITLIVFILQSGFGFANLVFDEVNIVQVGMDQTPLTQTKINYLQKYLYQNRDQTKTSTLIEVGKNGLVELDKDNVYNLSSRRQNSIIKDSQDIKNYNFGYGKAVYDANIAIVESANPTPGEGRYTYEGPYYCDLIISSLAKFQKIGNNICLPDYATFSGALAQNPGRTYVTMIKASEINTADLSKFGVIIFPDIVLGKHGQTLDYIGTNGINNIKTFVNNGGMTLFSSKSIILAQKMDMLSGVVDENTLIKHHLNQGKISLTSNTDFNTQVLNNGLYQGTNYRGTIGSGYYDYLLGSYLINNNNDQSIMPLRYFDISKDTGYYLQDITSSENMDLDADKLIAAFYKPVGKGYIVYNGGNSLFSPSNNSHNLFINHILNAVTFSFLRDIYTTAKVTQKSNPQLQDNLVPSLEKDIVFQYDFKASNVYNEAANNLQANVTIATGVMLDGDLATGCVMTGVNIKCNIDKLDGGSTRNIGFRLKVKEPTFTQAGKNIMTASTSLNYSNSKSLDVNQSLGNQTIDAAESAQIRASLNIDPGGYYPLPGKGFYIDQVINSNNTRSTEAIDVQYSTTIPLISPLIQENNQNLMTYKVNFSKDYYNMLYNPLTKTNYYPFKNEGACAVSGLNIDTRCKDFLIPGLLTGAKKYIYVDNYDEPIYRQSSNSDEVEQNVSNTGVLNMNLGGGIIKQTFFPDANEIMQHANPRRMVFEYPTKKEILFARQDIYFRQNPAYPLPKGISNYNQYITIDKFSDSNGKVCNPGLLQKAGSYGYPDGVKANEYASELECDNTKTKIDWNNLPEGLEQARYLHPISPENKINGPEDLEGFDTQGNYVGQKDDFGSTSHDYPIKFVKGAFAHFKIPKNSSLNGGYIEFDPGIDVNPDDVYILADHIAINKITKDGTKIRVYYYRGKMPNEQTLDSEFGIALENNNVDISNIEFKIYSLKYDISDISNINKYTYEQSVTANFSKYNFFKLPSVKMKFDMPRRKRINLSQIQNQNLSDGQISYLFTPHANFKDSLIFKASTIDNLNGQMSSAGLNDTQKNAIRQIFTDTPTESYVRAYENLTPFVRFGIYIQELAFHRTVYGPAEDHPIKDPGVMLDSALFVSVFNVGNSPIPFAEYLSTGIAQLIPMAKESTKILYKDIFGREFATPLRTVLPEAAPLPPPVRDFQMNTTYEVYDQAGNNKQFWDGETPLEIRENVKLYNNYPRYFNPTACSDNKTSDGSQPGQSDRYGACYDGTGTATVGYSGQTNYTLLDHNLDSTDMYWIRNAQLFNTKIQYNTFLSGLQDQLALSGLTSYTPKTLTRAQNAKGEIVLSQGEQIDDKAHNYSPEVENYYPQDYIQNNMRNLTHFDYDDSIYSKGYPYHMDNHIPNVNETILQPQNILAIPTYKGVGYKTKYFSQEPSFGQVEAGNRGKITHNLSLYGSWKYGGRNGRWPENLQNSDQTLLAGQPTVNKVPYQYVTGGNYVKTPLINQNNFTKANNDKLNNIYSCLFNPYELNTPSNKYYFKPNVLLNNVIPLMPWVQKDNEFKGTLTNYTCGSTYYNPESLSQVNNIEETQDAYRKYFAVNLRGEAKEALNIINRIEPLQSNYEGDVKTVEGGRFVYRNPAFGPNLFQVVDNPVSLIKSIVSDITVDKELIPYTLKNYKTDAYLLYTIKDPTEIFRDAKGNETARPWTDEIYADSRGGGNYSSNIYVGDSYNQSATKSMLDPGQKSVIRLDIYNNAGYDRNMLGTGTAANDNGQFKTYISGGIDFVITGQAALNANDLVMKVTRNVLRPIKYNFLNINVPDEIKQYVTVTPSDANIMTPGTFFDFDFVNVTTIRDGFYGSYYLDLQVSPDIPNNLRGKVYDIGFDMNPEYFDHLPGEGAKDPTKWPNKVSLPNAKFAIADTGNNAYYINGFSTGISLNVAFNSGFEFDKAYQITEEGLNQLRLAAGDGTKKHQRLRETFEGLQNNGYAVREFAPIVNTSGDDKKLTIDFAQNGINQFPYVDSGSNIVPKMYVLVHIKKDALLDGEYMIEDSSQINFKNYSGKQKTKTNNTILKGYSQGPRLDISYNYGLVGDDNKDLEIQKLYPGENSLRVKVFLKNIGTDIAFDPTIKVNIANGVTIDTAKTTGAEIVGNQIIIKNMYSGDVLTEGEAIGPGITNYFPIYLKYTGQYQPNPISLIDSASYQFTPFDQMLPALSGSYSTGFTLGFVQTDAGASGNNNDVFTNYLSGNTIGLYWDMYEGSNQLMTKETLSGSEIMSKDINLDPTLDHNIITNAFFKTTGGGFVQIGNHSYTLTGTPAYISLTDFRKTDNKKLSLTINTNKFGKYGGKLQIISNQGDYNTGKNATPDNGNINFDINNVDMTKATNIFANLYSGDELLTGFVYNIAAEQAKIYDTSSSKVTDNIVLRFSTNKIFDSCFRIKRDDSYIDTGCTNLDGKYQNSYIDQGVDTFKDHAYKVEIYEGTGLLVAGDILYSTPVVNNSNIPTKIFTESGTNNDITFNKIKDLGNTFMVDGTPVRYAVKVQVPGAEQFVQSTNSGDVQILFAPQFTLYVGSGWNQSLELPRIITDNSFQNGAFDLQKVISAGNTNSPMVFDNFQVILINNVWDNPVKVLGQHGQERYDIQRCDTRADLGQKQCFYYETNKLYISTKKFSKFAIYKTIPLAPPTPTNGGSVSTLVIVNNPNENPTPIKLEPVTQENIASIQTNTGNQKLVKEIASNLSYEFDKDIAAQFNKQYILTNLKKYEKLNTKVFKFVDQRQEGGVSIQTLNEYINRYGYLLYSMQKYKNNEVDKTYMQDAINDFVKYQKFVVSAYKARQEIKTLEQPKPSENQIKIDTTKSVQINQTNTEGKTKLNQDKVNKIKNLYLPLIKFGNKDVAKYYNYVNQIFEDKKDYFIKYPEKIGPKTAENLGNFKKNIENSFLEYDAIITKGYQENKAAIRKIYSNIQNQINIIK